MYPSHTPVGIDQYWEIVKRRWVPGSIAFLSILTLGIIATSLKENTYQAEAKLKFKESTVTSSLSESSQALGAFSPVVDQGNPIDTEAEVLRSVPLIKKTISDPELQLKNDEGERLSVAAFLNQLSVGSLPATDILKVSYTSRDPEESAKVVNTLVRNYLENNTVVNRAEAVSAREFLEDQLPKVEDALQRTETEIRQLKESNGFISPEEDTQALIDSLQEIQSEIAKAKGEMKNANSQANYLKDKLGLNSEQVVILNTISQSPEIRETVAKLQQAESELATVQARFTANSPNVIELQEQISSLEKLLDEQSQSLGGEQARELIKNSKSGFIQQELTSELIKLESNNIGLQQQINSLTETERNRRVKFKQVPQLEQKLRLLERQERSFASTYDILWKQLQTVRIAESQDPGNVRVISNAVIPIKPASSRAVGYLASGSLALLAAAGLIYLLEISDKSIKTLEEARQLFGYTWLGVIPSLDKSKLLSLPGSEQDPYIPRLVVGGYPSLPQSESYRMLQSNIKFLNSDKTIKSVVVTSSGSQEGKSTVAANLAAAMAQVGNKVLLVDANLHNPIQHRIWDIYNNNGLSNIIAEQIDPRTVTEEVMPNLDLLTSGVIAPSPATLLDSQRMRMLMDYWSEHYEFVILDTPALDLTADAPIIGRMADGVLLVVRPGSLEKGQASFSKEILEQSGLNMLGIVFNGVNPQLDSRSHFYHALEEQQSILRPKQLSSSPAKEELWETISSLSRESKKNKLAKDLDEYQLQIAPIDKLESMVFKLQRDLTDLTLLVKEQEEELLVQRQKVKKLQAKANIATDDELFDLESQLKQEQEIKRMLDETLVGQRRNLEKRREMLYQYQQVLESRQNSNSIF